MSSDKQINNRYQRSLWGVYTTNGPISEEHLELTDLYLLMRHDDNLKFLQNPAIQALAYYKFENVQDFYKFSNTYLVDNSLEKGELPTKLKNDFYMFTNKDDAVDALNDLRNKQDMYYEELPDELKNYASKLDLGIIDLMPLFANYFHFVLKDVMESTKGGDDAD